MAENDLRIGLVEQSVNNLQLYNLMVQIKIINRKISKFIFKF